MPPTHLTSILLIGVTGPLSFGQYIVNHLLPLSNHPFTRVAVYHDLSRPTSAHKTSLLATWRRAGIEILAAEGYTSPEPFIGFDAVLLFLGNHALALQPTIIDLAITAGVTHFYPSEYGADLTVGKNASMRYYVEKIRTRDHLLSRAKGNPALGWTYVLFGRLAEWAVLPHFGFENANATAVIYGTADGKQSLIAARDAAAYVVATLKAPFESAAAGEQHRRTIRVSASSPTYAEIFEMVGRVTGKTYAVTYVDVGAATEEEAEAKARGDVDAELAASHKLIQGLQGTLLPLPWQNDDYPEVSPMAVEDALSAAFRSDPFRRAYGLEPL